MLVLNRRVPSAATNSQSTSGFVHQTFVLLETLGGEQRVLKILRPRLPGGISLQLYRF